MSFSSVMFTKVDVLCLTGLEPPIKAQVTLARSPLVCDFGSL
jgi:hypothetical protein